MKSATVPIKNITRLTTAAQALLQRPLGMPGMGAVYGASGLGKSTATAWLVNQHHGIYVRAWAIWTPTAMFASLCEELSILPGGGCNKMAKAIAAKLNDDPRPIFLDEADYIVDSKVMTESLRDLHDMTHVPVILIGMEQMMKKLERREQLFNRLSQQVKFQKADIDDTRLLADRLCEIKVADDLLAQLLATPEVGGVVRRIVVALAHIEQRAKLKGLTRMDSATWGRSRTFLVEEPVGPQQ